MTVTEMVKECWDENENCLTKLVRLNKLNNQYAYVTEEP